MIKSLLTTSLLIGATLFSGCGENSSTNLVSDIQAIRIDSSDTSIYSTDILELNTSVIYADNTTADATDNVAYSSSDNDIIIVYGNTLYVKQNGGDVNITASYAQFESTSIKVSIKALKSVNFSAINTSDFENKQTITISGDFENNETNVTMLHNITWLSDTNITISESNSSEANITLTNVPSTLHAILFYGTDYEVDFNRTYK